MRLTTPSPGIFLAVASFEERSAPKEAGFRWHGGNCRPGCGACAAHLGKVWWTSDAARAARLVAYADEATKAVLAPTVALAESSRAARPEDVTVAPVEVPVPDGQTLLPYQLAGVRVLLAALAAGRKGSLLADEMGLGKTVQALALANSIGDAAFPLLVVCPASLKLNWAREAAKWLTPTRSISVVDSDVLPTADVIVVNYDRLNQLQTQLMARRWGLLVADEAHFAKNPKAARTKLLLGIPERKGAKGHPAVPGLVSQAERVLLLTGTPLLNRPVEIQSLLGALDPSYSGFWFLRRYCGAVEGRYGWDFSGASHSEELQAKLRGEGLMIRRKKADVLKDLPPKRRSMVVLPANGSAGVIAQTNSTAGIALDRIEEAEADEQLAEASGDVAAYEAAAARLKAARQVAFEETSAARHLLGLAKVKPAIEYLGNVLEEVGKVIVFAHHKDVLDALAKHFGADAVRVSGETPMADRQAAVDRFQTDDNCKVFLGNLQAAGVGLTLTAASTEVFIEYPWEPGTLTQAEDRAHRIGQLQSVDVRHLVLDGSLDVKIVRMLLAKQAVADAILDDDTAVVAPEVAEKTARAVRTSRWPVATDAERAAALEAVQTLASYCDGAVGKDGMGYNKMDARMGHSLAAQASLSDGQVVLAKRLARTYRRQLPDALVALLDVGVQAPKAAAAAPAVKPLMGTKVERGVRVNGPAPVEGAVVTVDGVVQRVAKVMWHGTAKDGAEASLIEVRP